MMKSEFEKKTNCYVTDDYYRFIELAYMESELDKDEFCSNFSKDKDFVAKKIFDRYMKYRYDSYQEEQRNRHLLQEQISLLNQKIVNLNSLLEREQEWIDFDDGLYPDEKYLELADVCRKCNCSTMTDTTAQKIISSKFGFSCDRITILHSKPVYQKNRHGHLREIGKTDRFPLSFSSDWNYYLFECCGITYEVVNGELNSNVF